MKGQSDSIVYKNPYSYNRVLPSAKDLRKTKQYKMLSWKSDYLAETDVDKRIQPKRQKLNEPNLEHMEKFNDILCYILAH